MAPIPQLQWLLPDGATYAAPGKTATFSPPRARAAALPLPPLGCGRICVHICACQLSTLPSGFLWAQLGSSRLVAPTTQATTAGQSGQRTCDGCESTRMQSLHLDFGLLANLAHVYCFEACLSRPKRIFGASHLGCAASRQPLTALHMN